MNDFSLHRYILEFTNISVVSFIHRRFWKTADNHELIISSTISDNGKLGENVLFFSSTPDNEAAVALEVDQCLNYNGLSVLCSILCHWRLLKL